MAALPVAEHEVHGSDRRREFAADEADPLPYALDLFGEQPLQMRLDAVLDQPGLCAQVHAVIAEDVVDPDDEPAVGLPVADLPHLGDPLLGFDVGGSADLQGARGAHPVQRLVRAAVGVDEHRAVGFDHQEPGRPVEVCIEAAGVVHGAFSENDAHTEQAYPRSVGSSEGAAASIQETSPANARVGMNSS